MDVTFEVQCLGFTQEGVLKILVVLMCSLEVLP